MWVHYDYMVAPDHSDAPNPAAIQMVVDAFKAHGVTLHIDPQHAAIPASRVIVPDWPSEYSRAPGIGDPSCTGPDAVRFSALQDQYFQAHSNHPWHYAVFGDGVFTDLLDNTCPSTVENGGRPPAPGMSGYSQVGFLDVPGGLGYDMIVALQGLRDAGIDLDAPANARIEAALFMHELGHNLGLCHSGPNLSGTDCTTGNYKPNYISVMNYDFEFGIPFAATPGSTAVAGWRVDYSDVKLPDLNESCLDETAGLQDTAHPTDITRKYGRTKLYPVVGPVDWNEDGSTAATCVPVNLNDDLNLSVLQGADDWDWLHSRLTPPAITNVVVGGPNLSVTGTNLMGPAVVMFTGGSSALGQVVDYGLSPTTRLDVQIPAGAESGPITVVTPEGKVESSQSVTITSVSHGPEGITAGPDGNVWFVDSAGNAIGRITATGAITEFPLPTPSASPWRITAGPDGNVWFTERAGAVGRITPSGKITEFPVPSSPSAIALGPDGNLWFTEPEANANAIGRITTTGHVTEFSIPTAASNPIGITTGPDGNVWFTESGGGKIGRITSDGAITEFEVPACGAPFDATNPVEIVAGSDGNLWFTGACPGRVTPSGAFTALPALTGPGLASGPDGNIWFTEPDGSVANGFVPAIAQLTPDTLNEFPIPGAVSGGSVVETPLEIAAGPDGNLWFTSQGASGNLVDEIGRITPAGQVSELPLP